MGRIPAPREINMLKGDPHKRRRHTIEPEVPKDRPDPPEDMTGEALAEWHRITAELASADLLSSADRAALVMYCEAWARYDEHKRLPLAQMFDSGVSQVSPAYSILKAEREEIRRYLVEFGLTPAARARLAVPKGTDTKTLGLGQYLKVRSA